MLLVKLKTQVSRFQSIGSAHSTAPKIRNVTRKNAFLICSLELNTGPNLGERADLNHSGICVVRFSNFVVIIGAQ